MEHRVCPFCTIAREGLPPHGLFENDHAFVLLDRKPLCFGHCMVVPKAHVEKVYELDSEPYAAVFSLAQRLAAVLGPSLDCPSVAYLAFGSGLPHAHLHLVPHEDPNVVLEPLKHVRILSNEQLEREAHRLRNLLPASWHRAGEQNET